MKTHVNSFSQNFRLVVSVAILTLFSVSAIFAQQKGNGMGYGNASPEDRAKRQTEMMKEKLSLTAAQEPRVSAINLKYAKKMEDVRKIKDTAVQRKTFQNLSNQKDGELKVVLTAEQYKSYLKQMEELKARRKGMQH